MPQEDTHDEPEYRVEYRYTEREEQLAELMGFMKDELMMADHSLRDGQMYARNGNIYPLLDIITTRLGGMLPVYEDEVKRFNTKTLWETYTELENLAKTIETMQREIEDEKTSSIVSCSIENVVTEE